jgi:type IV pilus assembly protein PilE
MKKYTKGFTLIELLVVIAIIGILSAIVLASLSTARNKGKDAAVESELSSMRAQAELFYSSNGNYGTVQATGACTTGTIFTTTSTSGGLASLIAGAAGQGATVTCSSGAPSGSATSWAVSATLPSGTPTSWCVDSTGTSTPSKTALGGNTSTASCQ